MSNCKIEALECHFGYTLPVFAVAAAKAALLHLIHPHEARDQVTVDLLLTTSLTTANLAQLQPTPFIPIEQVAALDPQTALAITRSDPGENLDLTRNTPIWAWVHLVEHSASSSRLILQAGEGLGRSATGEPAIYDYARRLFDANLLQLIPSDRSAIVRILLPRGRRLAERTSNAAFGVLEGLALLGTSGIAQPLSATASLDACRQDLQTKVLSQPNLVFCIGSHSRHIAEQQGFSASQVIQTANWIGALLVEAALRGARSVRLVGYQGKLIKLAGGIFNTSSHIADAKLEIICAAALQAGAGSEVGRAILACPSADAAYAQLVELGWSERVFQRLAQQILQRCQAYIQKYAEVQLPVAVLLLDRQGRIISSAESILITSD